MVHCIFYKFSAFSQDTWIIHSNNKLSENEINKFNFEFGQVACDHIFSYLFYKLNYKIINDPKKIKTYHYHSSNFRTYNINNKIIENHLYIIPYNFKLYELFYIFDIHIYLIILFIIFIIIYFFHIIFNKKIKRRNI